MHWYNTAGLNYVIPVLHRYCSKYCSYLICPMSFACLILLVLSLAHKKMHHVDRVKGNPRFCWLSKHDMMFRLEGHKSTNAKLL